MDRGPFQREPINAEELPCEAREGAPERPGPIRRLGEASRQVARSGQEKKEQDTVEGTGTGS